MSERRFIEQFEDNVRLYPEKVILRDQDTCLTFRELDELSGRVYAYLKKKGIGREDFVMIVLPRSVKSFVAMLGVWKAGAAMVLFEDDAPVERIDYVYRDCNCKMSLTMDYWDEIMQVESVGGYEQTDKHDAAFALYTSGSEGMPKGILHEYGKLELIIESLLVNGEKILKSSDRLGLPLPMSSASCLVLMIVSLAECTYVDVFPLHLFKDIHGLENRINTERITMTGIVPSMIMQSRLNAPTLRTLITGTEGSHGVYLEEYSIVNTYGQSESLITPLTFIIDKLYDNTPAGKPTGDYGLQILDEEGTCVKVGELCYPTPYTRGYINLPEQTAEVFRNGLFHTGDIARINEDGNYVILGRKTDMIKINGNRIEPAEIEAAVKRVLNLDWAFAKGFVEPERSFICVYYTADINIDYAHVREELMKILPTYMIPSYFVHIDSIPHLPNGKVDRQAFKAPEVADYIADYIPPTNELEERLCQAMQQVLGVERIGINDDFYLLGGDSLRTIRLVALCDIEGLNVSDIYTSRTPSRIAERWIKKQIIKN